MVEDDHMVIGLEDRVTIDHGRCAIADHPTEGNVGGEVQLADLLPNDLGVSAGNEFDDLSIAYE